MATVKSIPKQAELSEVIAIVSLLPPQGKARRLQVTMDERLLARIDAVTRNRSAFLSQAAPRVLERS
jgi:hypothetical protein